MPNAPPPSDAPPGDMPARLAPPPGEDLWVFGYGSLIWNPGFPHLEVRRARLHGYHRSLCIYSHVYRGTPERPGLVLGLDRGGSCEGLAFRVPESEAAEVMDYLYARELVTRVYLPRWLSLRLSLAGRPAGDRIIAAGFVVDRDHLQYAGHLSPEQAAEMVVQGHGVGGACKDYVATTLHHLEALGLADGALRRILRAVERRGGGAGFGQ